MNYQVLERQFFKRTYALRNRIYGPVLRWLADHGITANHITYARTIVFIVGVLYPMFVYGSLFWSAVIYFILFWGLDTFDGQLARYTKSASDKGRFTDIFTDITGYSLYLMGLAFLGAASVFVLFYQVIIHAAVYALAAIYKNENERSDWIIRAEPNLTYFKLIAHISIITFILFGVNILEATFILLNAWMTLSAVYYFVKWQRQSYKKS